MTSDFESRLSEAERGIRSLVGVCSAVADDTLRVCFILDELSRAKVLPILPWGVATNLVELHHATQALKQGSVDSVGEDITKRIKNLQDTVTALREDYRKVLKGEGP